MIIRAVSPSEGLCATCRSARMIRSARGTTFVLCTMSERDAVFSKYPRLPVTYCDGYATTEMESTLDGYIRHERKYWDGVRPDPASPQIWHDPFLFELFFAREFRWLIDRATACGLEILELGCGEGVIALELARRGCRVTGIDLSPARVEKANAAAREQGLNDQVVFRTGDLNTLALEPQRYSCILAHDTLHHVFNLNHVLLQVRSALRPDGVFLVMDYCGMGLARKTMAAALYALLPTYKPYREKWKLRKRLKGFLSNERQKRSAVVSGDASRLHPESPFEEISQSSLPCLLHAMFVVTTYQTMLPFWFYLAPKLRIPRSMRPGIVRLLRAADDLLSKIGMRGAYFILEARIPHAPTDA